MGTVSPGGPLQERPCLEGSEPGCGLEEQGGKHSAVRDGPPFDRGRGRLQEATGRRPFAPPAGARLSVREGEGSAVGICPAETKEATRSFWPSREPDDARDPGKADPGGAWEDGRRRRASHSSSAQSPVASLARRQPSRSARASRGVSSWAGRRRLRAGGWVRRRRRARERRRGGRAARGSSPAGHLAAPATGSPERPPGASASRVAEQEEALGRRRVSVLLLDLDCDGKRRKGAEGNEEARAEPLPSLLLLRRRAAS